MLRAHTIISVNSLSVESNVLRRFLFPLLVFILAACGGEPAPVEAIPTIETTPLPSLVARVNGIEISREAFLRERARWMSPNAPADPVIDESVINALIAQVIFEQAAEELGVTVSDEDLDTELSTMRVQAEQTAVGGWQTWLSANGFTEAQLREAVRDTMLTTRVRSTVLATLGEVETIQSVRARHILLETEADAEMVKQRLQNGDSFDALAAEFSRDISTKDNGGDLGFFVRDDLTTPELAELAFALQPGQMAGPIQTILGWHIVETLAFEDRPITDESLARAQEAQFNAWLNERKSAATIERF
jgi:parvulin-like peptidyl-prolyl isomerase